MMQWRLPLCLLSVMGVAPVARAQPPSSPPAASTTLLHLSASGSVQVAPDQLVAGLVANSTSPSAAMAQRRVNGLMAEGMKAAQAAAGIDARATGYAVSPVDERHLSWTAQQTLELRGADGAALLELAGRLQAQGLAMAALDWELSPSLRRHAHDEAVTQALGQLQAQAASAAATLGLHVDHLQEVRLDSSELQSRPAGMMAMSRMGAASPPQATAAPEQVDADVSADVLLRP